MACDFDLYTLDHVGEDSPMIDQECECECNAEDGSHD